MRLLVFSDGHVGDYAEGSIDPATGLNTRLLDTLAVWDWIHDLALSQKADGVVFGGDRFKPHRPPTWMRDLADAKITKFERDGIPLVCLLGNHDLFDKAGRFNSYGAVDVWSEKTTVFDKPGVLRGNVSMFFMPYGCRDLSWIDAPPTDMNLLFFHDEITGLSSYGKRTATGGIPREVIDKEEFSLVLGGHVHLRQNLAFHHTAAAHIGSPLERIEDGDQGPKGALLIDIEPSGINVTFVESPMPKIVEFTKSWHGDMDELLETDRTLAGNVVKLTIEHSGNAPKSLRKEMTQRLRSLGVTSPRVVLKAVFAAPAKHDAKVTTRLPIGEQLLEYTKQVDSDPILIQHMEEIKRRGEAV